MGSFISEQLNSNNSILFDIKNNEKKLLVIFGGIRLGIGLPIFEFFNTLKEYDINVIFLRDYHQAWYQLGIKDISSNIIETERYLKNNIIEKYSTAKECIFLGNSAGGFASLLFGSKLKIGKIVTFAPQTFINFSNKLKYCDLRWRKEIFKIYLKGIGKNKILDIKKIVDNNNLSDIHIYYSKKDKKDSKHILRLNNDKIHLYGYNYGDHRIVKHLKDNKSLFKILNSLIEG